MNPFNKIKQDTIQGKKVQIYLLPATEGLVMAKTLAKVVVPTMGSFYTGAVEGYVNFEQVSMVLMEELEDLDIQIIVSRLLKELAINGTPVDFDEYFMANYGELTEIVAFALKENFSSFFAAKGLFEKFLPKVEKADQSPAE